MFELKSVSFAYGNEEILNNFSLKVNNGECVCLFGPSGSGKTTVLRLVAGLIQQDGGTIDVKGEVAVVFQEDRLVPWLTLLDNLKLTTKEENQGKIEALLLEVGLIDSIHQKPSELSGGMKRRVAIVRAILSGGDILLLDEPFNGLDRENKIIVSNIIKREFLDKNKSILLISHVEEDAKLLGAKIIEM